MTRIGAGITVALLALSLHPAVRAAAPEPSGPPAPPLSIIVKLRPASASRGGQGVLRRHGIAAHRPVHEGRVRARAERGLSDRQLTAETGRRFGVRARRRFGPFAPPDLSGTFVLRPSVASRDELRALVGRLNKDPDVEWAQEDGVAEASFVPDDPYYSSTGTWGQAYDDLYGLKKIGAAAAWDTTAGEGVTVAVVDTGVDRTHPDLANNIWVNAGEIPNNGVDDDANGYVDDAVGWDFVGARYNAPAPDADPGDGHGHGTHVAGTVAAEGDNGLGVVGVAWRTKVMAIKGLDDSGYGLNSQLAAAIVYATDSGADVINASWGGTGASPAIQDAIDYATSLGVVFVAAAGNNGEDARAFYPAGFAKVVTVAASDAADALASFSNRGPKIDVAAPGVDILSLRAQGTSRGTPVGELYTRLQGTSMAAPHVAGLAALVLSRHPSYTTEQVRQAIRVSAADVGRAGFDTDFGYGRIDAAQALTIDGALEVAIQGPPDGEHVTGPVPVTGLARGAGFLRYELAWGEGQTPTEWTVFEESGEPLAGELGTFDTGTVTDGLYTLRLTAFDAAGRAYVDRRSLIVDYVRFTDPAPPPTPALARVWKAGGVRTIEGTATGPSFAGFRLEWAPGINPASGWSTAGVTLAGGGSVPVGPGPVATWDTTAIAAAGYYTLRLLVDNAAFTGEARTLVYLEPDLLSPHWPRVLHRGAWPGVGAQLLRAAGGEPILSVNGILDDGLGIWRLPPDGSSVSLISSIVQTDISPFQAASADLDGQTGDETVAGHANFLGVFRPDGTSFQLPAIQYHGFARTVPVLDDLDGVPGLEILACASLHPTGTGRLQAWKSDGTPLGGAFPVPLADQNSSLNNGPSRRLVVADLDADGVKEIVVAEGPTATSLMLRRLGPDGRPHPSWTAPVLDGLLVQLAAADLDGDGALEVLALTQDDDYRTVLHVFGVEGSTRAGWPVTLPSGQPGLAIGDLDRDGRSEVVVTTSYEIHVLRADGQPLSGVWPRRISGVYFGQPLVADLDGDGLPEIVVSSARTLTTPYPLFPLDPPPPSRSDSGMPSPTSAYYYEHKVVVLSREGAVTRSWLALGAEGLRVSGIPTPVVGDADGDGRTDIVLSTSLLAPGQSWANDSGLTVIATGSPHRPGANDWPSPLRDDRNTSVVPRDTTAPTVALTAPVDGATITDTTTVLAVASDDAFVRGVQLRVDGADVGAEDTQAPFTFTWDPRGSGNGPHVLTAEARDPSGNRATSVPVSVTVDVDLTPPQAAVVSPEAGATVSGPLSVLAEASDDRGVTRVELFADQSLVGAASVRPYSFSWDPRTTGDGAHALVARAYDAAGNVGESAPVAITVAVAPTVLLTAPAAGATISGPVSLAAAATDNSGVVRVEFRANEAVVGTDTAPPWTASWNALLAPDGPYTLTARALDAAGNEGTSAGVAVTVSHPPVVTITSPAAGAVVAVPTVVSVTASDGGGIGDLELLVDGVVVATDTEPPYAFEWNPASHHDGLRILTARAHDTAGHAGVSAAVSVMVAVPPVVTITAPAPGAVLTGSVLVTADATDNYAVMEVDFYVDGVLAGVDTVPPWQVTLDTSLYPDGAHALVARALDPIATVGTSAGVDVSMVNPRAAYDPALKAPRCATVAASCSSGTLLNGRGPKGPEPNQPNTTGGTCADGQSGTYHVDESNDRIRVATLDGSPFAYGKTVRVEATVWAYSAFSSDKLDLYYAADARNPAWTLIGTFTPAGAGARSIAATYTLPLGALQAVRARFRYAGTPAPCGTGPYDDHDDLAFAVDLPADSGPPAVAITAPARGATVSATVPVAVDATDDNGVTRVELYADGTLVGTDATAPYVVTWNPASVPDGDHSLVARGYDILGKVGESPAVPLTVSVPPSVSITGPAPGAVVGGVTTVSASASDNGGVARVEFSVDGAARATDTTAPYGFAWDTTAEPTGSHTLTATAYDLAGNATASAPVTVTVQAAAPSLAVYDATYKAPRCSGVSSACDSGTLLVGRGTKGPEPNAPNTIGGTCGDGTGGSFHVDESNDRVRVSTLDGSSLAAGKAVRVEVTVWAYAGFGSDKLDLYYAASAASPAWTWIATLTPAGAGPQVLSASYTLPGGSVQAVRARFRYSGAASACSVGTYDDHDDLVFSVQ